MRAGYSPTVADTPADPDTLALASMIADHLRGIPINPAELPPGAHRLVAAYCARHDYGTSRAAGRIAGIPARFVARDHTGAPLPDVPPIDRAAHRTIDAEPTDRSRSDGPGFRLPPAGATVMSAPGGQGGSERNPDG